MALAIGQLGLGGTEGQVVMLARGLKERGVEVGVASLFEAGPRQGELEAEGIPVYLAGFPPIRKNSATRAAAPCFRRRPLRQWARVAARFALAFARYTSWLRAFRPQLVHAFLFHAYVLTPAAARLAQVPLVIAARRSLGHFKEGRRSLLWAERVASSMTDLVTANSRAVADDVLSQERLDPHKLIVIPNGIPSMAFAPQAPAVLRQPRPLVLCVANFMAYKGHRYLLDACHRLASEGLRLTLALAGDGPLRGALEAQARAGPANVLFLGQRTDVYALLVAADLVVLPSLEEGLSNSLLEAMALGKPIVATDVGGNREALGTAGLLVQPADADALARAIKRALCTPCQTERLGMAARSRALANFSERAMIDAHLRLYESALTACVE